MTDYNISIKQYYYLSNLIQKILKLLTYIHNMHSNVDTLNSLDGMLKNEQSLFCVVICIVTILVKFLKYLFTDTLNLTPLIITIIMNLIIIGKSLISFKPHIPSTLAIIMALNFILISNTEQILTLPIYLLVFPSLSVGLTSSIKIGLFMFVVNFITTFIYSKSQIYLLLNSYSNYSKERILNTFLSSCADNGLILMLVVYYLVYSREKLVNKLYAKTKELEKLNKKLEIINDELKISLKAKDTFLLSISHELRNPLNILLGNIELSLMNQLSKEVEGMLENAKASGEMLLHLINNLLDSGKMENNHLEICKIPTAISSFLQKLCSNTKILVERRGLKGELLIARKMPLIINIDPHRLMQIALNLIANAVKFTEKGTIQVTISWVQRDDFDESILEPTAFANSPSNNNNNNNANSNSGLKSIQETSPNKLVNIDNRGFSTIIQHSNTDHDEHTEEDAQLIPHVKVFKTLKDVKAIAFIRHDVNLSLPDSKLPFEPFRNKSFQNTEEKLDLNTSLEYEEEGFLKIEVKDSGCGMSDDELNKLFQKFSQVGSNATKSRLGTGLGLWIAKNLCYNMEGGIKAFSKKNEGSVFVAAIKCSKTSERFPLNHLTKSTGIKTECMKIKSKALIVDDVKSNQHIIGSFVKQCGIEIIDFASNGQEAVTIYKSKESDYFDIIFMDLEMPIMDGKTACVKIREYELIQNWAPANIVIVTGNVNQNEFRKCLDPYGSIRANYIYPKPFTLAQCQNIVELIMLSRTSGKNPKTSKNVLMDYPHQLQLFNIGKSKKNSPGIQEKYILVVDDDPFNVKLICNMLERKQFQTITAKNGENAVEQVKENYDKIKLILMDCEMPIMDGCQATLEIKKFFDQKSIVDIPIFGITGHAEKIYRDKCLSCGMSGVFIKPISSEVIVNLAMQFN